MTDRLKGCVVAFEEDIRDDDAEAILNAIRMIKGVSVVTGEVSGPDDWMNRERIRLEIRTKLLAALER